MYVCHVTVEGTCTQQTIRYWMYRYLINRAQKTELIAIGAQKDLICCNNGLGAGGPADSPISLL